MKIRLDSFSINGLAVQPGLPVELQIVVGEGAMKTKSVPYTGENTPFPDIYEFEIDDIAYVSALLEIEVEAYAVANPDQPALLGAVKAHVHTIFATLNEATFATLPLQKRGGEVRVRAILNLSESTLDDLKHKVSEADQLRAICADYEGQLTDLDRVNKENIAIAEKNIDKLTKKYQSAVEKFNELQEKFLATSVENERLQGLLFEQQDAAVAAQRQANEAMQSFRQLNDELSAKISSLTLENENLKLSLRKEAEDREVMRLELDELYANKYEDNLHLNDQITRLSEENQRLRDQQGQQEKLVAELTQRVKSLSLELDTARAAAPTQHIRISSSIVSQHSYTSTVVNQTYIDTLLTATHTTQTFVTNILQSTDVEAVKRAFCAQLQHADLLTQRVRRLEERLQQTLAPLTIFARTRPPTDEETAAGHLVVDNAPRGSSDVLYYDSETKTWASSVVDEHWGYEARQEDVWASVDGLATAVLPQIDALLEGRGYVHQSAAVLAYGGQGSGRSFTLFGFGAHAGLAYRALQRLFERLEWERLQWTQQRVQTTRLDNAVLQAGDWQHAVRLSLVEVHPQQGVVSHGGGDDGEAVRYDAAAQKVHFPDTAWTTAETLVDAVTWLASRLAALHAHRAKSAGEAVQSAIVLQVTVHVQVGKDQPGSQRTLLLAECPPCDNEPCSPQLKALEASLLSLGKESTSTAGVQEEGGALMALLRPFLQPDARTAVIFTLAPTDLTLSTTRHCLSLASRLVDVHRGDGRGAETALAVRATGNEAAEVKTAQLQMRRASQELQEARRRCAGLQETLKRTQLTAASFVQQSNERNKLLLTHYEEEKGLTKQLQLDLDLTHRHLRRVLEEVKDQKRINERLLQVLKVLEDERQSALLAKTAANAAAAAGGNSPAVKG